MDIPIRRRWIRLLIALFVPCLGLSSYAIGAPPQVAVELEIVMPRGSSQAAQQWVRALERLDLARLRIHTDSSVDGTSIEQIGTPQRPRYKVVGLLTPGGELRLPKATFSPREVGKLQSWLQELGKAGIEGVTAERGPFGLTPSQLAKVRAELAQPIAFSTQDMQSAEVVHQIAESLEHRVFARQEDARALKHPATLEQNELQGLATGTALAILLRPCGMELEPRSRGRTVEYALVPSDSATPTWPLGNPLPRIPGKTAPRLFQFSNVQVEDFPLDQVVAAIEKRAGLPFLRDTAALTHHGIDLVTAEVTLPPKRITYSQALRSALSQAGLKHELKVDDANRPFVWITTARPLPSNAARKPRTQRK